MANQFLPYFQKALGNSRTSPCVHGKTSFATSLWGANNVVCVTQTFTDLIWTREFGIAAEPWIGRKARTLSPIPSWLSGCNDPAVATETVCNGVGMVQVFAKLSDSVSHFSWVRSEKT